MSTARELEPYVGPRPFGRDERQRFFGRDRESDDLLSLVLAHPAMLVYAASGAGKSSVLNAGLIPRLEDEKFHVLGSTHLAGPLPRDAGRIANTYLFNALSKWNGEHADLGFGLQELAGTTLQDFLLRLDQQYPGKPRALIFDQFEEFFTHHVDKGDERRDFIDQIAASLRSDRRLRIVFAMREEYVVQFEPFVYQLPDKLRTRMRLEPLRAREAMDAIRKPLETLDLEFERGENDPVEGLVTELRKIPVDSGPNGMHEVIGEFVDPLHLQVVCQDIWRDLPDELKAYAAERQRVPQRIEHEKKIITSTLVQIGHVDTALSEHYDRAIAAAVDLSGVSEGELRRWFSHYLISDAGIRRIALAEDESTERLPKPALEVLQDQRLIRAEARGGSIWYELTHDRFIKPVQTSNQTWFQRRAPAEALRLKLETAAGVPGSHLGEVDLREAEQFLETPEATLLGTTDAVKAFVRASRERVDEDKRRRERELEESRKRAESERARAEKRRVRAAYRRGILVATILTVAVLGSVWLSLWWQRKAEADIANLVADGNASLNEGQYLPALVHFATAWSAAKSSASRIQDRILGQMEKVWSVLGNQIRQWKASDGSGQKSWVLSVALSGDGTKVVTGAGDGTVRLFDVATGQSSEACHEKPRVTCVNFRPNADEFVAAFWDGKVRIYNRKGESVTLPEAHHGRVNYVEFSHQGDRIVTASDDLTARLWWLEGAHPVRWLEGVQPVRWFRWFDFNGHEDFVKWAIFSPDDTKLLTASFDGTAKIWDAGNGFREAEIRGSPQAGQNEINCAAFSSDGRKVATAGLGGTIALWDTTGKWLDYFPTDRRAHRGRINSLQFVQFMDQNNYLVTASDDGTAKLWTDRGQILVSVERHNGKVLWATFSPKKNLLATCGEDGTVRITLTQPPAFSVEAVFALLNQPDVKEKLRSAEHKR